MELIPDAYYKTRKGNVVKYSFAMMSKTQGKGKHYMFWDCTRNTTVTFSELEITGLTLDEGSNLIYG